MLTIQQVKKSLTERNSSNSWKDSPYKSRTIEENLDLFNRMRLVNS
jgi:hypothetical protein